MTDRKLEHIDKQQIQTALQQIQPSAQVELYAFTDTITLVVQTVEYWDWLEILDCLQTFNTRWQLGKSCTGNCHSFNLEKAITVQRAH